MSDIPNWHIVGDWFDNCSCAVACPCTFAQPPDNGFCESVLFWHVREGHYGEVQLDNLNIDGGWSVVQGLQLGSDQRSIVEFAGSARQYALGCWRAQLFDLRRPAICKSF